MPETMVEIGQYSLQRVSLAQVDRSTLADWESFSSRQGTASPQQDPVWLRGFFAGQLDNLRVYFLYQSGKLCGVAPFLLKDWPLKWHLGEVTLARPRMRRLRLLGGGLNFPEDVSAYDMLFNELARTENSFDTLYFEEVPPESFLGRYLQTSLVVRHTFRRYLPEPPAPHLQLRFRGSFEDYMTKFSKKHRHELRREVRRVRDGALGEMRFVRYTNPEEVSVCLRAAVEVSQKTYQWNLHQRGLISTDLLEQRMVFAAEHGWLRSYLLFCNDIPHAFLIGFQYGRLFLPHEMGFDPAAAKYSIGTVLQLLAVEDLFAFNVPEIVDLGGYGTWKNTLSTDSYLESKVFLFRPGCYTRFVQEGHQISQVVTRMTTAILERARLKTRLKKMIRGWSTSSK